MVGGAGPFWGGPVTGVNQGTDCSVSPTVMLLQLEESGCLAEGEGAESTSLAAARPNSRHPVALWDGTLDSLDFLENRLLPETERKAHGWNQTAVVRERRARWVHTELRLVHATDAEKLN